MDAVRRKCDAATRDALGNGRPEERLEVLVRVIGQDGGTRGELEKTGLEVHSASGPIVTGLIERSKVNDLAALPFVRRVELSRPLFVER
jgi:hypothetical protein